MYIYSYINYLRMNSILSLELSHCALYSNWRKIDDSYGSRILDVKVNGKVYINFD